MEPPEGACQVEGCRLEHYHAVQPKRLHQMLSLRLDLGEALDLRSIAQRRNVTVSDLLRDAVQRIITTDRHADPSIRPDQGDTAVVAALVDMLDVDGADDTDTCHRLRHAQQIVEGVSVALSARRDVVMLRMYLVEGLSLERIGKRLGISTARCGQILARARRDLADGRITLDITRAANTAPPGGSDPLT